jgi:hypothetical protein
LASVRRSLLAFAAAALPCAVALADNPTWEGDLMDELGKTLAPLALSADGRTRVHGDDRQVLHRVALAEPARDQTF